MVWCTRRYGCEVVGVLGGMDVRWWCGVLGGMDVRWWVY